MAIQPLFNRRIRFKETRKHFKTCIQAGLKYVNQVCNGNSWKMKSPKQLDITREYNYLIIGQYLTFRVENEKKNLLFTRGIEGFLLNVEEHPISERAEELFHCVK